MLGQFTIRFYKGSSGDELIFETLDPLPSGLLRATLIEALRLGILALRKQNWPFLTETNVIVEKKTGKVQQDEVPASVKTDNQNQQAMTALQELFLDN
jgi:hypothetical protein